MMIVRIQEILIMERQWNVGHRLALEEAQKRRDEVQL